MHLKQEPIVETDLVLIYIEEKPVFYGRVEKITPDVKPKWWRVKFLFLTIPFQMTTWIIDEEQIRGADFTMGGTPIRIEKLALPKVEESEDRKNEAEKLKDAYQGKTKQARVLSLHSRQDKES